MSWELVSDFTHINGDGVPVFVGEPAVWVVELPGLVAESELKARAEQLRSSPPYSGQIVVDNSRLPSRELLCLLLWEWLDFQQDPLADGIVLAKRTRQLLDAIKPPSGSNV